MVSGWKNMNFDKMLIKMQSVNSRKIEVGIVTPKMHTRPGRSPIPTAQIYQWQEEGTSDGRVPARPTLRRTFQEYQFLMIPFAKNLMFNAVKGTDYKKPMVEIGNTFSKLVKQKIMDLKHPQLSPYTIATRVNAGTTNPLVDTGQLMEAVGFRVA